MEEWLRLENKNRNNNIGIIHFVAAIFVMYGHMCDLMGVSAPILFGSKIQALGVKIIFVISGYLITKSLWRIKGNNPLIISSKYIYKRFSRIFPEYISCLVITAILIAPYFSSLGVKGYFENFYSVWIYIYKNFLFFPIYGLPGLFENNPYPNVVNGSLWTMPVEIVLYAIVLIPIFFGTYGKKCISVIYAVIMTAFVLMTLKAFPFTSLVIYGTDWMQGLAVAPYFLIGSLAFYFDLSKLLNVQASFLLAFVTVGLKINTLLISELLCMVSVSWFVLSFSLENVKIIKWPSWIKTEYSYGIYLYGFFVQQCVIEFFYKKGLFYGSVNILVIISLVLTYLLAAISYEIIYKSVVKFFKIKR